MKFTFAHNNLNVYDLDKSLAFYQEALGSPGCPYQRGIRRQLYPQYI